MHRPVHLTVSQQTVGEDFGLQIYGVMYSRCYRWKNGERH